MKELPRIFKKYTYVNGNYIVRFKNGSLTKRLLRFDEDFKADFPDSIDLKITNKCTWNCPWCHENSILQGKTMDLEKTKKILEELPEKPIEIAIGGGDVMSCPNITLNLIEWIIYRGMQPRITINIKNIENYLLGNITEQEKNIISSLDAIGVSIEKIQDIEKIEQFYEQFKFYTIFVLHVIVGIFPIEDLKNFCNSYNFPILILGYKTIGRGKLFKPKDINNWKEKFYELVKTNNHFTIGFDNLALEQLDIKNNIPENIWSKSFFGNDGEFSMYIDAVEQTFSKSSISENRTSWDKIGLLDYFNSI